MSFGRHTTRSTRWLSLVVVAGLLGLSGRSAAGATAMFWNGANQAANPAAGGAGTWDNLTQDWRSGTAGGAASSWQGDGLGNFAGTAGTVTIGAPIVVDSMTFGTTGYTIADTGAFSFTLGSATPTIDLGTGTDTTFATTLNIPAANFAFGNPAAARSPSPTP